MIIRIKITRILKLNRCMSHKQSYDSLVRERLKFPAIISLKVIKLKIASLFHFIYSRIPLSLVNISLKELILSSCFIFNLSYRRKKDLRNHAIHTAVE